MGATWSRQGSGYALPSSQMSSASSRSCKSTQQNRTKLNHYPPLTTHHPRKTRNSHSDSRNERIEIGGSKNETLTGHRSIRDATTPSHGAKKHDLSHVSNDTRQGDLKNPSKMFLRETIPKILNLNFACDKVVQAIKSPVTRFSKPHRHQKIEQRQSSKLPSKLLNRTLGIGGSKNETPIGHQSIRGAKTPSNGTRNHDLSHLSNDTR